MRIRNIIASVIGLTMVTVIIIGLINFNLMVELWVKLLVGVLFVGAFVTVVRGLFQGR